MATVFKNSNSPYWRARYFNADGVRVSKSTGKTSKREAERIAAGFEADERDERRKGAHLPRRYGAIVESAAREAAAGTLSLARAEELIQRLHREANPDFREVSLKVFWREWIAEQKRHVSVSTAAGYEDDLDLFAGVMGKRIMDAPPRSLTVEQVNSAMDKALKAGRGKGRPVRRASTVNKALSSLRRVMEAAIAKDMAIHNPAKQSRALRETDSVDRAPFTAEEIRKMIDHEKTSGEWKGAILIAAHTGLRLGDVLGLGRQHISGSRLVIQPAKTARMKKVISVPLSPQCLEWIGERKGAFFPTLKRQRASKNSMQFTAIMKKAGVPKDVELPGGLLSTRSFHALRHTFASWMAEANVPTDVRQKLTGHSSSRIHAKYTHHDEALDRAVETLPTI